MEKRLVRLVELIEYLGDLVLGTHGVYDENSYIDNLSDVKSCNEFTLDWINPIKTNKQEMAENSIAKCILCDTSIKYNDILKNQGKVLIKVENPKRSLAEIGQKYFVKRREPAIHFSAIINERAKIGSGVYIGENCVIGDCVIGDNCSIYPNVTIYDRTIIGNNTKIHSGAVICVDGLGCIRDVNGELLEFPQLGGVVIGDNVYIGANTHIASGALADTIICDGCKINGMSFIGSNCHLGKNVWITGSTMLAGSVKVGANTTIFSKVIIRDQITIGEWASIAMGAVVTKNVPSRETWAGCPAKKLK